MIFIKFSILIHSASVFKKIIPLHLIFKETKMDFKIIRCLIKHQTELQRKLRIFSMEFAIDQALKIYSGGLDFGRFSRETFII